MVVSFRAEAESPQIAAVVNLAALDAKYEPRIQRIEGDS
jgi:hypothetical protein